MQPEHDETEVTYTKFLECIDKSHQGFGRLPKRVAMGILLTSA
jgi:hypothetical protein